jgi:hypothetical protein
VASVLLRDQENVVEHAKVNRRVDGETKDARRAAGIFIVGESPG